MPPSFRPIRRVFLPLLLVFLAAGGTARAHPAPDVPVRAWFDSDGTARFEVEFDLRCFVEDPLNEPYFVHAVLTGMDEAAKAELKAPAKDFLEKTAEIRWLVAVDGGQSEKTPFDLADFSYDFAKVGGGELAAMDDPVAVVARWQGALPEAATGYQLAALDSGELSVLFLNQLDGRAQKRMQVLFPGEISKVLDLTNIAEDAVKGTAPAEEPVVPSAPEGQSKAPSASGGSEDAAAVPEAGGDASSSEAVVEEGNRATLKLVGMAVVGIAVVAGLVVGLGKR